MPLPQGTSLNDPILVYDLLLKGSAERLLIEKVENLTQDLAELEQRLEAAGA